MLPAPIKDQFRNIVGPENFLDAPEALICYGYDASLDQIRPQAVLLPGSTEQVSRIMSIAYAESIPVTARGAGTNLSGGSVPSPDGIVVCLTRMAAIVEINPGDRLAVVQPGVINGHLQAEVEKRGLFYPPDPGSMHISTIGGNVAENASGPRGVKYGVTRDYLLGLTAVLADGRVVRTGGRTIKNVTGLDLTSLFCGCEGTLGIITEITLKLVPKPEDRRSVQAAFGDLEVAGRAVQRIIGSGIIPVSLELMDHTTINLIEDFAGFGLPRKAQGLLLAMVDGPSESLPSQVTAISDICSELGATGVAVANTPEENDRLWTARRSQFGVMTKARPDCIVEDVTVPVSRLAEMIMAVRRIAEENDLLIAISSHAGDGNLHPHILTDRSDAAEWQRVEKAIEAIVAQAVALKGTLSGEHGIGTVKAPFMDMAVDSDSRTLMAQIKASLDPKGILNPGKFL